MTTGQVIIVDDSDKPTWASTPLVNSSAVAAENAAKGLISLTIPADLVHYFSSDDYSDMVNRGLFCPDAIATWVARYPGVIQTVTAGSSQVGSFIDYSSENWYMAFLFFLAMGIASAVDLYHEYKGKQGVHNDRNASYKKMHHLLNPQPAKEKDCKDEVAQEKIIQAICKPEETMQRLDKIFAEMIDADANLKKKYKSIRFAAPSSSDSTELKLDIQFQTDEATQAKEVAKPSRFKQIVNKVIEPFYSTIGLSSFVYWIIFISAAAVTGSFADFGIAGLAAWAAFGVPFAIGIPYSIIKVRNWEKNKGNEISDEHARLTKMADADAPELLAKAVQRMELDREIERLEKEHFEITNSASATSQVNYTPGQQDKSLGANPNLQAGAVMYTTAVGRYVEAQYNAWIIGDFMKSMPMAICVVPMLGPIVGSLLMAIGLGFGLYEANKKHKAAKASWNHNQDGPAPAQSLLEIYEERKKALVDAKAGIETQKSDLKDANKNVMPALTLSPILDKPIPSLPAPMTPIRKLANFFEWKTTGIYFFRIFFTIGAAIFLPFAAAVTLSNPVTISLLALSGLIFVGLKIYQAHQRSKEAEARMLTAAIKGMDEQLHVAKMTSRNLVAKTQMLRNTPEPTTSSNVLELPSHTTPTSVKSMLPLDLLAKHDVTFSRSASCPAGLDAIGSTPRAAM